jgi:hypothetical protein
MTDDDDGGIVIQWFGWYRTLRPEIVRSNSIKAQVLYDGGSFELVFPVARIPKSKAAMEAALRTEIERFADQLKRAVQKPIRVALPDPPDET